MARLLGKQCTNEKILKHSMFNAMLPYAMLDRLNLLREVINPSQELG